MIKKITAVLLASIVVSPAWAGSSTVNYNSTGASPFATTTDGSSNNYSRTTVWDYSAAANGQGVDSSHGALVDPGSAAAWNTTWAGGTLGAMANYGTSPGAVLVPGVNASVTNTVATTAAQATAANLNATVVGNGTFAVQLTGATNNINNIAGTISLPTGASTSAFQATNTATTSHTCSVAGFSELGCLGQIDDDVKGPIAAQTAPYTIIGGVINGADTYNTVAASQTAQALTGGSGGATGDYLSHCVIQPTSTSAGTVVILDNSTTVFTFTTGTLSNLVPFTVPVGAVSVSGAWKVTTGANETATCVGKFH